MTQSAYGTAPVFEALAHRLVSAGVDTTFGLMGEDTAKVVRTLQALDVAYLSARHENTAVAMADGYARASGRLGVCLLSRGPGLTNGLTAAVNAAKAGSSVLIITGADPVVRGPNAVGPDYKAFDNTGVATRAGLKVFSPSSGSGMDAAMRDAIAAALRGATVVLMVPLDVLAQDVDMDGDVADGVATDPVIRDSAEPVAIDAVVDFLRRSERPLIVAGHGAHRSGARAAIVELAERTGALLGTSLRAKDMFHGHPYDLGIIGTYSHMVARDLVAQADLVLVVGASLTEHTTEYGELLGKVCLIHVDADRTHIGRYTRADVAVVGDARTVAEQLIERLPARTGTKPFHEAPVLARLSQVDRRSSFEDNSTRWTTDPRTLVLELASVLPADRLVATDVGNFSHFVGAYHPVAGPGHYHYPFDFSAIGLGLGLAMGVAAARPEHRMVLFIGDGALLMTLGELETVGRCDLPLVIVVMNDAAYGAEVDYLAREGLPTGSAMFPDVDFGDIAESVGMHAVTVRSLDDLMGAAGALADPKLPVLLDCKVTPTYNA